MSVGTPETLTIERRISPAQVERRERVRDAARDLAEAGGYAAVTMGAVARRSGVARATIYRYFASKDHLLAELAARWSDELAEDLRARPPRGATPAERVASAFRRVMQAALDQPRLTAAIVTSVMSSDPEAMRAQQRFTSIIPHLLDVAIDGAAVARRAEVETVFGHVFFSTLVNTTTGRISGDEALASLESAASLLFAGGAR